MERDYKWQMFILIPIDPALNAFLTSDSQRSGGVVVSHRERDSSRVSCSDSSKSKAVHPALSFDHVHFIILQWDVLELPLDQRCVLMRKQTLEADIFALVHNAALQEFQYAKLDLCLTNTFH